MEKSIRIGLDVGSVSLKMAVLLINQTIENIPLSVQENPFFYVPEQDGFSFLRDKALILSTYIRHYGNPRKVVSELLENLNASLPEAAGSAGVMTGSGGRIVGRQLGFGTINEYRAAAMGVGALYPEARTLFELGGERSKYIRFARDGRAGIQILDYENNGECAAGTGSFFDQQVSRLKYEVEEIGVVVEGVKKSAVIAGRCSVFAKSDMIHAQQRGYTPPQVLKGLCDAVVRNFKGSVAKGKRIEPVVALIGGVAANRGVVTALREQFRFSEGELVVPEWHAWMGAIGAAASGTNSPIADHDTAVRFSSKEERIDYPQTDPLSLDKVRLLRNRIEKYRLPDNDTVTATLGIDVGSVSTNLALIDGEGRLIDGIYTMTDGRPVEVVTGALKEMSDRIGIRVRITGVGTTGSGRELVGMLTGADVIKDEITAHKTGALHVSRKYLNREVDTIFEIGGQDSKFISMKNGVVIDFSLNEACAAGTGSFLEEQAGKLKVAIKDEFAQLALRSAHPLKLGERCTVFMEKELGPYLHRGVPLENVAAGLARSVVHNYLNRVVKKRKIGDVIFFQGGTAYNDSVAAAFSTILKKEIIVPPHNGIMGAIGAALLARDRMASGGPSSFRGWELNAVDWSLDEFTCDGCSNACTIQKFMVDGDVSFWGDKCSDRYRKKIRTRRKPVIENLVKFRDDCYFQKIGEKSLPATPQRGTVGIPRALHFWDRLPFWSAYFQHLGFEVILSNSSRQDIIHAGVESTVAEPCFPVQLTHGHLIDLIQHKTDIVFLPNVVNEEDPTGSVQSFICPWTQTSPLVAAHTPALNGIRKKLFYPNIQFREGPLFVEKQLRKDIVRWGIGPTENRQAVQNAYEAQRQFVQSIGNKGGEVLNGLGDEPAVILLGRPYNLYDPGLNLNIPVKLRELYGINVIPMDFLPLDTVNVFEVHDHMFWNFGRKIIQAARFTRDRSQFHLIYLSNFKCGPDSYIRHYIEEASGGPFLFLQLDSHANDAGVMTRIEAFLDSKGLMT